MWFTCEQVASEWFTLAEKNFGASSCCVEIGSCQRKREAQVLHARKRAY
jgi:hypothetical protein